MSSKRIKEVLSWGGIYDVKQTGLYANGGRICPICSKDSGKHPLRLDFEKHHQSRYFHLACAKKLKNADNTFFSQLFDGD